MKKFFTLVCLLFVITGIGTASDKYLNLEDFKSWDNSNNGFSVSKYELKNNSIMSYSHSACWNNGNADIFSGKYDYENGASLDKKMLTVQQLIKSDENYEKNYINKNFNRWKRSK